MKKTEERDKVTTVEFMIRLDAAESQKIRETVDMETQFEPRMEDSWRRMPKRFERFERN